MYPFRLSLEQEAILTPGDIVVTACPGAGKTRSIVSRYLERPGGNGRGVALLSFTNRAVFEAKARCAVKPETLSTPNFIGTFDAFINRFIVLPWFVQQYGFAPNFLKSWHDLPREQVCVRISNGVGIGLWSFGWSSSGGAFTLRANLDRNERAYLRQVEGEANGLKRLEEAAASKLRQLVRSGFIDSEAARYVADRVLSAPQGELLLHRLAHRFEEVIVDEAQDCDKNEFDIIQLLRSAGVRTVVVADPDQSIYEFRGASQQHFLQYRDTLAPEQRVVYRENYRSSAPICALATSLRFGREAIHPIRPASAGDAEKVLILVGSAADKRQQFLSLAEELGIPHDECIALAHKRSRARELAGVDSYVYTGTSKTEIIIMASGVLSHRTAPYNHRTQALFDIEQQILGAFDWPTTLRLANRHRQLEALGATSSWLRDVASQLLLLTNRCFTRDEVGEEVRKFLQRHLGEARIGLLNLSSHFRKPSDETWNSFLKIRNHPIRTLQYETVHGAKGGEWDAVLLDFASVPSEGSLLNEWAEDVNSEGRRVLYVGATRARKALALSTCERNLGQLEAILACHSVSFQTKYC